MSIVNDMFNLKSDALRDSSVSNVIYREYRSEAEPSDLEKNININVRDTSEWMNMNNAYLEVRGRTKQAIGDTVTENSKHAFCLEAGGGAGIFETTRLRVANTLVESNDVYSHYTSFIKNLMTKCDDYHKSVSLSHGFNVDVSTAKDYNAETRAGNAGVGVRTSLIPRTKSVATPYTISESQASFWVPLRHLFSYFSCNKVMKGVQYRLELVRRELYDFILHAATGSQGLFSINKVSLWVPIVHPSLSVRASLENMVSSGAKVPWSYMSWKTYASDANQELSRRWTYNTQSDKPLGAFLFCKHTRPSAEKEQDFNNMIFDNSGVTSVQLLVNGNRYPYTKYEPNYTNNDKDTTRVYAGLMEFLEKNKGESETGSLVNILNHTTLFPLYYFNLHNIEETSAGYQLSVELDRTNNSSMRMFLVVVSEKSYTIELNSENVQVIQN